MAAKLNEINAEYKIQNKVRSTVSNYNSVSLVPVSMSQMIKESDSGFKIG